MADLELVRGVADVARDEWNALVGSESPFLEWDFLASLEEAGAVGEARGWTPRPLVARRAGRVVAACPLYVKTHSEGEFVFDFAWADAALRAGIPYYPKLLVGVPFTPVGGARFLVAAGEDRARHAERLAGALRELCEAESLSGVHVNFCREDELAAGARAGFLPRIGVQYHWHAAGAAGFDGWLARFRHKRRNQIRRERRALAEQGIAIEVRAGDEVGPDLVEPLFRFYCSTADKRPWGRRYLPKRFFELLVTRFRRRLVVVLARREGRVIAGTLNVQKGDTLYGRYWGCDEDLPHLHFNVCYYAAVEHCLRAGLSRFEPGAGGDYKQARGFDARPTWSLHWLADARLRRAVARFLEAERSEAQAALAWLGEHSAYKAPGPG
jgi:predicted N-acyltransferase